MELKLINNEPRPFNLSQNGELSRLLKALIGYMRVSITNGTDHEGRQFAYDALLELASPDGTLYNAQQRIDELEAENNDLRRAICTLKKANK